MTDLRTVLIELGTVIVLVGMSTLVKYTLTSDAPYIPKHKRHQNDPREEWEINVEQQLDARAREGGRRTRKNKRR